VCACVVRVRYVCGGACAVVRVRAYLGWPGTSISTGTPLSKLLLDSSTASRENEPSLAAASNSRDSSSSSRLDDNLFWLSPGVPMCSTPGQAPSHAHACTHTHTHTQRARAHTHTHALWVVRVVIFPLEQCRTFRSGVGGVGSLAALAS
jgi:hypothetical protein